MIMQEVAVYNVGRNAQYALNFPTSFFHTHIIKKSFQHLKHSPTTLIYNEPMFLYLAA